jgi:hypothetical protein
LAEAVSAATRAAAEIARRLRGERFSELELARDAAFGVLARCEEVHEFIRAQLAYDEVFNCNSDQLAPRLV